MKREISEEQKQKNLAAQLELQSLKEQANILIYFQMLVEAQKNTGGKLVFSKVEVQTVLEIIDAEGNVVLEVASSDFNIVIQSAYINFIDTLKQE